MRPPEGFFQKIKALRIGKAMTFKKIYEELVVEYPDITLSWVSKWGKGLPLLSELIPDGNGGYMKRPPTHCQLWVTTETKELFELARKRLASDYHNHYSRQKYPPNDDEVVKDLLTKC
jgi:hypothetical protein